MTTAPWRNVRARGWRSALVVGLLAFALAANTIVFSVADSLVFHRLLYDDAERLITFQTRDARTGRAGGGFASAPVLDEWRRQTDLFVGVHAHLYKTIFLSGNGEPELVPTSDVTPGLIEVLGARTKWGRSLVADDARRTDVHVVLIDETLARTRFGDPAQAVDQKIETTAEPLLVVGVMPASFRFPDGTQRIWRAFDPRGPLAHNVGLSLVARVAPGISSAQLTEAMAARSEAVYAAAGAMSAQVASPSSLRSGQVVAEQRRMLYVLFGAAVILLLTACANAASLELAGGLARARTYAIQLAIGASRGELVRTTLIEGLGLVGAAASIAALLAYLGTATLVRTLPSSLTASVNPIDIDERALLATTGLAALAWLLSSLPMAVFVWRANLIDLLRSEGHSVASSTGGARVRRALTVAQVALAVMLLVGSLLYVQSYLALLRLDKGFDSGGVVAISLTIPPQRLTSEVERGELTRTILDRVRSLPGVVGAFAGAPPPSTGDAPTSNPRIEVDDTIVEASILVPRLWVDPDYFRVLGIPLLAGRMFAPGDAPTDVIVTEALARRLWPGQNAIGHRFREDPQFQWSYVIGVVPHIRTLRDGTSGPSGYLQKYSMRQPPAAASRGVPTSAGLSSRSLSVTARVDSRARVADLYQVVRGIDARNILKVELVDDQYARQFSDRLLAARVITAFGILAFAVAAAGIYGLMAFLVVTRGREIGIRIALGADGRRIRRLVLESSLGLVALGAACGIGGALVLSRWAQSQLYGVSATDSRTIALVTVGIVLAALLATWHPARQAARIDPAVLLKK